MTYAGPTSPSTEVNSASVPCQRVLVFHQPMFADSGSSGGLSRAQIAPSLAFSVPVFASYHACSVGQRLPFLVLPWGARATASRIGASECQVLVGARVEELHVSAFQDPGFRLCRLRGWHYCRRRSSLSRRLGRRLVWSQPFEAKIRK